MSSNVAVPGPWEYFVRKVSICEPWNCWLWKDSVGSHGYGNWAHNKTTGTAHRASYRLFYKDPGKLQVNHKCGNRRCCNPNHLYAGTQLENFQDMLLHGTHVAPPVLKGEQVGNSKLTNAQASTIKTALLAGVTGVELAQRFEISPSAVSLIRRNRRYAHVPPFLPERERRRNCKDQQTTDPAAKTA